MPGFKPLPRPDSAPRRRRSDRRRSGDKSLGLRATGVWGSVTSAWEPRPPKIASDRPSGLKAVAATAAVGPVITGPGIAQNRATPSDPAVTSVPRRFMKPPSTPAPRGARCATSMPGGQFPRPGRNVRTADRERLAVRAEGHRVDPVVRHLDQSRPSGPAASGSVTSHSWSSPLVPPTAKTLPSGSRTSSALICTWTGLTADLPRPMPRVLS